MKLPIAQLKEGENRFHFHSLSPKETNNGWLKDIVHHVEKKGYRLEGGIETEISLTQCEPDYYLKGQMVFNVHQDCARCAEDFTLQVKHPFHVAMAHVVGQKKHTAKLQEESDELDVNFFEGTDIDLAPIVEEQFFLSLPFQAICRKDCKGICQSCGKNLNSEDCRCYQARQAELEQLSPFASLRGVQVKK